MDVIEAIKRRRSTRVFLDKPVSRETVEAILDTARWAASGGNLQPWRVVVVTGNSKQRIGDAIIAAREVGTKEHPDQPYYPAEWFEPYKSRRKASGIALYQSMAIAREDELRKKAAWYSNYRFFDAPVGLLFFIDRRLATGSLLDIGMLLQSIMLTALTHGLATCPQASLADYPDIVRNCVAVSGDYSLVCGMSLGYADTEAAVNKYRTERAGVSEFVSWCD